MNETKTPSFDYSDVSGHRVCLDVHVVRGEDVLTRVPTSGPRPVAHHRSGVVVRQFGFRGVRAFDDVGHRGVAAVPVPVPVNRTVAPVVPAAGVKGRVLARGLRVVPAAGHHRRAVGSGCRGGAEVRVSVLCSVARVGDVQSAVKLLHAGVGASVAVQLARVRRRGRRWRLTLSLIGESVRAVASVAVVVAEILKIMFLFLFSSK